MLTYLCALLGKGVICCLDKQFTRCWRMSGCVQQIEHGSLPSHKDTAKAIAKTPQSELPDWTCAFRILTVSIDSVVPSSLQACFLADADNLL